MIGFLITGLFLINSCRSYEVELNGDANVYKYMKSSLEELKVRQLAEKIGIHLTPSVIQRATSVCYDELGCFDKDATFKHLKQLPEPPEMVNAQFLLYTRKNPIKPQFLDYKKPETILNSNINPSQPLKIITHGFGGKNNLTWVVNMKNALLEKYDLNVIVIDWSLGARVPYYIQAAVNTELVGAEGAVLYYFLKDRLGMLEKDLHIIGFSLGAHVVGFIGKRMKEMRGTRPARITGLDPAGPLFEDYGGEVHLYKDDADFVDVVHTNADHLLYGGVGMETPIGDVDYYPNGGKRQPGCGSTLKGLIMDVFKGEREKVCNHERAVHLFTDSVLEKTPCEYKSFRCESYSEYSLGKCLSCTDDCGRMGYKPLGSGIYYLMTKAVSPFCTNIAKLKVKFPTSVKRSYGSIILTFVARGGQKENITLTGKDEKLSPGAEKLIAIPVTDVISDLHSIQVLYLRYDGWITKGRETFGLASVTLQDSDINFIYKSCSDPVTLKDKKYLTLKQTEKSC